MATEGLQPLGLRTRAGPFVSYIGVKLHFQQPTGFKSTAGGSAADGGRSQHGPAVFVAGLPLGFDEASVQALFSCFGDVEQVVLHGNKRSGMVVFHDQEARDAAVGASGQGQIIDYTPPPPPDGEAVGLKAWVQQHKALRPGNDVLQKQIDEWMAAHEAEEERKQRERQAAMAEDGWTVVVRSKGRSKTKESSDGVTVRTGGVASAQAAQQAAEKKEKAPKFENFYRFQKREQRRSELMELRHRFEEDRKRITELRASRNFKPY